MGIVDRTLAAFARRLTSGDVSSQVSTPTATTDAVSDPSLLASAATYASSWLPTGTLVNMLTGIGTSRDSSTYNSWQEPRKLDQRERYGMGRNALINQVLSKLPNTATREGWIVDITDERYADEKGAIADQIAAYEQRLGIGHKSARALTRGRQHGEALVWLGIEDGQLPDRPVDINAIETIRWAVVIDSRHYQPAELYPATSEHFGQAMTFRITDINGILEDGQRQGLNALTFTATQLDAARRQSLSGEVIIHADRVLHFPTTDYLPLLDTLQEAFAAYFESMYGIRTAARESSTIIHKISKWTSKMWDENAPKALQHMRLVNQIKSSQNAYVVDKENEDVSAIHRNVGGLADLANPFMVWLAAATATPVTIMWGVSPGGFGKGEAERETWHEEARAYFYAAVAPQLRKLHDYILAAKDGCGLPVSTQREIAINDLSPPDEKVRGDLRSQSLSDLRLLVKDGIISRAEARAAVLALRDDYFRPAIDLATQEDAELAPVGVFTGGTALLQAVYPNGIPVEAGRNFLLAVASTFFNEENIGTVFPDHSGQGVPTSTATGAAPGDIEDDEANPEALAPENAAEPDEPNEVDLAWSNNPIPADAMEAPAIAAALGGIPTVRITRAHRAGLIEGWSILGGKPRYSLTEVKRAVLQGNGKLPAPEVVDVRDANTSERLSLVVVARAPEHVARWVPYKAKDTSAPHVTLLYVGEVETAQVLAVVDAVRGVLAQHPGALALTFDGVGYFDKPDKRVAFLRVVETPELLALHEQLRAAVEGLGIAPEHAESGYTPHLTLAYLAPGEAYVGPMPQHGWDAEAAELWCDDFAMELPIKATQVLGAATARDDLDDFDEEAWLAECRDLSDEAKEKRIAEAFKQYHATVNMGAAELREWAKTAWSKKASVSRAPIERNLTLLETPREKWTLAHAASANRTINFVSRMKGAEQGEPVKIDGREGPSKRDISLKNWAFDPRK